MKKVHERFLEYVKVDTKSDETTRVTPSTKGQLELGKILAEELKEIGVDEVRISDKGYVYACLKNNCDKDIPKIGFISHMDTAPDMSGKMLILKLLKIMMVKILNLEMDIHYHQVFHQNFQCIKVKL